MSRGSSSASRFKCTAHIGSKPNEYKTIVYVDTEKETKRFKCRYERTEDTSCARRCGFALARRVLRGVGSSGTSRRRSRRRTSRSQRHARDLERVGEALHVCARVVRADRHAQRRSHRAPLLRNAVRDAGDNAGLEELCARRRGRWGRKRCEKEGGRRRYNEKLTRASGGDAKKLSRRHISISRNVKCAHIPDQKRPARRPPPRRRCPARDAGARAATASTRGPRP